MGLVFRSSLLFFAVKYGICQASVLTWNGSTDQMNQSTNWSPAQVPANGDQLIFPTTSTLSKSVLNNIGSLTVGDLTISDAYTFTGSSFVIPSGATTLNYGASGSTINLGGITLNGTWEISSNGSGNTITSAISGAGNLDLQGGLLIVKGVNSYTGTTTLGTGATLRAGTVGAFGTESSITIGSGAVLDLNSFNNTVGNIAGSSAATVSLGTATLTITNSGTNTFAGTISGTNGGVALAAASTGVLILTGNNTYSTADAPGTTAVSGGTLQIGYPNALGTNSNLTVATGATLDLNNYSSTFGTISGAGTITLGSGNITCAQGGTFSGVIQGSGGLTVTSGTLTLTGANSYTGGTTIEGGSLLSLSGFGGTSSFTFVTGGGTLKIGAPVTSALPFTLTDVATIDTNGNAVTLSGPLSGPASFSKKGEGVLTVTGANGYTGATNVLKGTLRAGSVASLGTNSSFTISTGATLDIDSYNVSIGSLAGDVGSFVSLGSGILTITNSDAQTPFYGVISGPGSIVLTGGTLTLMKTNSYTGTTTVQGGTTLNTLSLGATSSLIFSSGGGNIGFGSTITSSASIVVDGPTTFGTNTFNVTLSGAITGNGAVFSKIGLGTLTLTGANSNAGPFNIEGGVVNLNAASLGSITSFTFETFGGTLQLGEALTISQPITLTTPGGIDTQGYAVTMTGPISGPSSFTKAGSGTLTVNGAFSYLGMTIIESGTLNISSAFYPSTSQLVFQGSGGGVFQLASAFSSFSSPVVFMGNGTIDTNGFDMTISGVVAGNGSFTKVGAQTLTLTGSNIYTGATNVNVGSLVVGSTSALGVGSAVTVASGATLAFQTFANTVGAVVNSGTISSGATVTASSFTQNTGGTLSLDFPTSAVSPVGNVTVTGMVTLDGALIVTNTGGFTASSSTEVILLQSSGSGKQLQGTFSSTTVPFGVVSYDYSDNQVILAKGNLDSTWTASSTGNWGNAANWSPENVPGGGTAEDQDTVQFIDTVDPTVVVTLANAAGTAPLAITLHGLYFDSSATSFTIEQFNAESSISLDSSATGLKPKINVISGDHTINTVISLEKDSRISLSSGSLTLGADSSVISVGTLIVSEGSDFGTLTNYGKITPGAVLLEGNTVENQATISPAGTLTISALSGLSNLLIVNNYGTMTSGGDLIINGNDTEVNNYSGGQFFAGSGQTLSIMGGVVFNSSESGFGSSSSALVLSGGSLDSFGEVLASSYTQTAGGSLILNVGMVIASTAIEGTFGSIPLFDGKITSSGAINLDGSLQVGGVAALGASERIGTPLIPTEIILLRSLGSGKQLQGEFSSTTLFFGSLVYDYSENLVILANGVCDSTWNVSTAGNWGNVDNWTPACAPGVSGIAEDQDRAEFVDVSASSVVVTLADSTGTSPQSLVLHDLSFASANTDFTIEQFSSASVIHLDGAEGSSKPKISVTAGNHTINATIFLEKDSRISLSDGNLTLGEDSSIVSVGMLYVSEGSSFGTLTNNGKITPSAVLFEGNTIYNFDTVSPDGSLTISGLGGIVNPVIVNNYGTMSSGDGDFTIGGGDGTVEVSNLQNGMMFAGTGKTLYIAGGTTVNAVQATLGSTDADLLFTGGSLSSNGKILAKNYEQSAPASLELGVTSVSSFASVTANGTATLGGSFVVTALPSFSMSGGQSVSLIKATEGVLSRFSTYSLRNFPHNVIPSLTFSSNAVKLNIVDVVTADFGGMTQIAFTAINQHNVFVTRKMYQMRNRIPEVVSEPIAKNSSLQFSDAVGSKPEITLVSMGGSGAEVQEKGEQLTQRVREEANPWSVYAGPTGSFGHVKTSGKQIGLGYSSAGALLGFDYVLTDAQDRCCLAGFGAIMEYRTNFIEARDHFGSATTDAVHGSLYGTVIPTAVPHLAFEAILGFDYGWDHVKRNTGVHKNQQAVSNTNESIIDALLGVEYQFSGRAYSSLPKSFSITPLANIQYIVDYIDSYKEKGAGIYNLSTGSKKPDSLASLVGIRLEHLYKVRSFTLRTELDAGWQREYLQNNATVSFTPFNMTSHATKVHTAAAGRNNLILGLDMLMTSKGGWQLETNVNYQLNSLFYDLFFYLGVGREF